MVLTGLPTFLSPCVFHFKACVVVSVACFLSVWPIQYYLRLNISVRMCSCAVLFQTSPSYHHHRFLFPLREIGPSLSWEIKVSVICSFLREGGIGPTLNLLPAGTRGLFSVWTLPLDQSGKVEPARDQGPSRHSSKGHWATPASPPRQGDSHG